MNECEAFPTDVVVCVVSYNFVSLTVCSGGVVTLKVSGDLSLGQKMLEKPVSVILNLSEILKTIKMFTPFLQTVSEATHMKSQSLFTEEKDTSTVH